MKEAVNRELLSVTGLEPQEEDKFMHQLEKLSEAIHQLQQWIADLELYTIPDTL